MNDYKPSFKGIGNSVGITSKRTPETTTPNGVTNNAPNRVTSNTQTNTPSPRGHA